MKTAEQILDEFYSTEEPLQVGVDFYYRNEVLPLAEEKVKLFKEKNSKQLNISFQYGK